MAVLISHRVFAFGDEGNLFFTDGKLQSDGHLDWTQVPTSFLPQHSIRSMAQSPTTVMIVGVDTDESNNSNSSVFATAPSALTPWTTPANLPVSGWVTAVTYSPELGLFVAGGKRGDEGSAPVTSIAISDDEGSSWSTHAMPLPMQGVKDIVWADDWGLFIAVGFVPTVTSGSDVVLADPCILISADAQTWTQPTFLDQDGVPLGAIPPWSASMVRVLWAPEIHTAIAISDFKDAYLYSADGITWRRVPLPPSDFPPEVTPGAWAADLGYFILGGFPGAV